MVGYVCALTKRLVVGYCFNMIDHVIDHVLLFLRMPACRLDLPGLCWGEEMEGAL